MKAIETLINHFNKAWTEGQLDILPSILHNEVVFVAPDLKHEIQGKEACIQTIRDYLSMAVTHSFIVTHKKINCWEDTAAAILEYEIDYELNDTRYKESGIETWMLAKEENDWKLLWRGLTENKPLD